MKDFSDTTYELLEGKKEELNEIITLFKLNKESLIVDQYNEYELFKKIRDLSITKGGFVDNNIRRKLWNYLFYKRQNKKNIIDIIKINNEIKVSFCKLNILAQKKELTGSKLQNIKEYQVIINDLPRTCQNIIINNINKMDNKLTNISPEIFMFASDKFEYQYLQGLLNIIFYFKQIFNYEDSINALNIYFEFFYKDLIDIKISKETNDENIALISSIITELYNYLYQQKEERRIINYIETLSSKWIISSFLSELKDINKGYRILDYLIVSEPYIKYVLATVLLHKFNDIIITKEILNSKLDDLESSYENFFYELKKDDLNNIDINEIINEVENLIKKQGKDIKNLLIEKYGKKFIYSFNLNNHGLLSYYKNLVELMDIKKPKKKFKIYLGDPKYYKYFFIITSITITIYYFYKIIDESRMFW